jgi:tetratricopeptide (TPR) repeat protein
MDDPQVRQEMNNIMNKMLKNDEINLNKEIQELIYDTKNKICIINAKNSNNENSFLSNYCIKDLEMFIKNNNIKYSLIYNDLALSLVSLNIDLNDLLFSIVKSSKELTKLDIAMNYLNKAQTIDPGDFMTYFLKGIILEYRKDYNNAAEHYWQAYKTIKNFALVRGYDLNFYQTAILLHILRVDLINNNVSEANSVEKLINEKGNTRLGQIKLQLKDIYLRNESEDLYKIISAINQ